MRSNWLYALMAFLMSVTLWYMVTGRERVETLVEVKLEFKGIPSGLVVREGLTNKISVRIRGPKGLIRSLNQKDLSEVIDLASLKRGSNVIPLVNEKMPAMRAFDVLEVLPPRLVLEVDAIKVREIPVEAAFKGELPTGVRVDDVTITPAAVKVRGPETLVDGLRRLRAEVPALGDATPGMKHAQALVITPELAESDPPEVAVSYRVALPRKEITLRREVKVEPAGRKGIQTNPSRVTLLVDVPEAMANDTALLGRVEAWALVPEEASPGTHRVPVQVRLPDGAKLVDISSDTTVVTLKKR